MKRLTILIFLNPFLTIGQTLEQRMTTTLCECFTTIDENKEYDSIFNEFQGKCLPQLLTIYKSEIESLADTIQSGTEYQKGQQAGRLIYYKTQYLMIYNCDKFFNFVDNLKHAIFKTVNRDNLKSEIVKITEQIKNNPTSDNYFNRALNFFGLEEYKLAKRDIDKAIKLNDNFAGAFLLRGQIYEMTENYERANNDYREVKRLTNKPEIDMFIAIVDRKSKRIK